MRELPIIFSAPMIRTILDDRKTMTRRVVKPQPHIISHDQLSYIGIDGKGHRCPYGQAGDLLYVREAWAVIDTDPGLTVWYPATDDQILISGIGKENYGKYAGENFSSKVRSPRFFPKWAARIWLEVTGVRVERVQEISEEDAKAEGVEPIAVKNLGWKRKERLGNPDLSYARGFWGLWNSINGKKPGCSWEDNIWVWVIEFRRVKP